jgi:hypothetical protein
LKIAYVTPIPKKGYKGDVNDLRPISVLPALNKIVEISLKDQLETFLISQGVHDARQFGFRRGSGTDLAVIELNNRILSAIDENKIAGVIFFDVSKAFDSISHEIIFSKLEHYGVRGLPLELIKSYFNERHQAVKIENIISDFRTISRGTAQGSNKGPFYFNLSLDDFKNLPLRCESYRFADDICCLTIVDECELDKLTDNLAHDIEIIEDFHRINGMQLNAKKTKFMLFRRANSPINQDDVALVARKLQVEDARSHCYLGFILHENAKLSSHFMSLTSKIKPAVNALSRLKWYLSEDILLKIYFGHVHSHLMYLAPIFSQATATEIKQIQTIQKRALKHVYKLPIRFPSEELFTDYATNVLPLKGLIAYSSILMIHKIVTEQVQSNLKIERNWKGLRNNGELIPWTHKKSTALGSDITCAGVKLYNELSAEIRRATNIDQFKFILKKHLLSKVTSFL